MTTVGGPRHWYEALVCMLGVYRRECRAFCQEGHRWRCQQRYLGYDAASIAADMAEAERLSGRNPRGALSKEIPL